MSLNYKQLQHPFKPIYDERSRILILGSFPSVKSRENQFYYGHPQNRFWKMIAGVTGDIEPISIEQKRLLLLKNQIAIWDILEQCDITGSGDSSIKNPVVNDLDIVLKNADIRVIAANGTKAYDIYMKYIYPVSGRICRKLPSTSPANAAWSVDRLIIEYKKLLVEAVTDIQEEILN